jgi:hypothetical protein
LCLRKLNSPDIKDTPTYFVDLCSRLVGCCWNLQFASSPRGFFFFFFFWDIGFQKIKYVVSDATGTVVVLLAWKLGLQLPVQPLKLWVRTPFMARCTQSIQYYMIKFVSDLRHVGGFLRFPPSIKLSDLHDIREILLKVALNTINQANQNVTVTNNE